MRIVDDNSSIIHQNQDLLLENDHHLSIEESLFKCLECFEPFVDKDEYIYHITNIHVIIKFELDDAEEIYELNQREELTRHFDITELHESGADHFFNGLEEGGPQETEDELPLNEMEYSPADDTEQFLDELEHEESMDGLEIGEEESSTEGAQNLFNCDQCTANFAKEANLNMHIQLCHQENPSLPEGIGTLNNDFSAVVKKEVTTDFPNSSRDNEDLTVFRGIHEG